MTELQEIKESQIRSEENIKTILSHITTIHRDIELIKADLADNTNEITLLQAENKFLRESFEAHKSENKVEFDKVFSALREKDKTCIEHGKNINLNIEAAKRDVFKDVRLWFYAGAVLILLSVIGTALYTGKLIRDIETIKMKVEELTKP